jgi:tryptophanyl-tRNA synthetase
MKKRVFSGIQPTGTIHLGNYLGAIQHWVRGQPQYDNIFCIVDLHAITVPVDPKELKSKIRETAGLLLAAGIDPDYSVLFIQSHVNAHPELAWIINCIIPLGWMQRMTQFKEKTHMRKEKVSLGLFAYPALMAADILLYETDLVPVGEDQKQHLELTRDVASRFNSLYGETFKLPEPVIPPSAARIMGLDNPLQKMSKSETRAGHALHLLDPPEKIRSKISKATTDPLREIRFDPQRPGLYNLLVIYEQFTGESREKIEARFEGSGYADLKRELSEVVIEGIRPLQERYRKITADKGYLEALLQQGSDKIRPLAEKTLGIVKEKLGLG